MSKTVCKKKKANPPSTGKFRCKKCLGYSIKKKDLCKPQKV